MDLIQIDRRFVLKAIDIIALSEHLSADDRLELERMATTVEALPSVQPERKKGKWIEYNATGKKQWMCSECCAEEKNPKVARFCYWCGADMRGENDD